MRQVAVIHMTESYLTIADIAKQYPKQWVLLDKPEFDRYLNLLGGHLVASSPDREAVESKIEVLSLSKSIAVIHTGTHASAASPLKTFGRCWFRRMILLCLIVGTNWVTCRLTVLDEVPKGVRAFRSYGGDLDSHANDIRDGRLKPIREPKDHTDQNEMIGYPLTESLHRAGISSCMVWRGIIVYWFPASSPIDGGQPCLIAPLNSDEPVQLLPGRLPYGIQEFRILSGNWAYWFAITG